MIYSSLNLSKPESQFSNTHLLGPTIYHIDHEWRVISIAESMDDVDADSDSLKTQNAAEYIMDALKDPAALISGLLSRCG